MSTFRIKELIVTRGIPIVEIIHQVVDELDWSIVDSASDRIILKEKDRFDYYNALEMSIDLISDGNDNIELSIHANNDGYGPVQDDYIKNQVLRFIKAIRSGIEDSYQEIEVEEEREDPNHSLSQELERLAKLHEEGELTDEEFSRAKEKVINE